MTRGNLALTFLLASALIVVTSSRELTFNADGSFTILQITDLHYGESLNNDRNNMKITDKLIKRVKPDMVAVTGDVIHSQNYRNQTNFAKNIWNKFTRPMIDNNVPYAFVMGNRDTMADANWHDIYAFEKNTSHSLLGGNTDHRVFNKFNYFLPIFSSFDHRKVVFALWVFNSHAYGCMNDRQSLGCVAPGAVQWFKAKMDHLNSYPGNTNVQHIAFVHIPLPEFRDLYNDHEFYGTRNEEVLAPTINTGLFEELKKYGVEAVYVGHDHLNDFGGMFEGVELVYGRKTGYGGYSWYDPNFQRGARVIKLQEKKDSTGKISIEREHYVVVENPEFNGGAEEDRVAQKKLHRRHTVKQAQFAYPHSKSQEVTISGSVGIVGHIMAHINVIVAILAPIGVVIILIKLGVLGPIVGFLMTEIKQRLGSLKGMLTGDKKKWKPKAASKAK